MTWESGQNALRNPLHSAKILLRIIVALSKYNRIKLARSSKLDSNSFYTADRF